MGFVKAFAGAVGGTFADQWQDFLTVPPGASATAALVPAQMNGADRSENNASTGIITNGSRVIVPPGFGLITLIDGRVSGFLAEPGGYELNPGDQNAKTIFRDGLVSPTLGTSWERFKYGGQAAAQHVALFVNLKEITGNRFGTQSPIHWDDGYLNAQVAAVCRGTYTLRIVDPILFISNLVPAANLQPNSPSFDLSEVDNPVGEQLFTELVGSLAAAFSKYTNDPQRGGRITNIQADSIGFAQSLSDSVEANYQWTTERGLVIPSVAIASIEYDADTTALLSDVRKADALAGGRGNSFMQQATARGVQAAGESGGGEGLAMLGMGAGIAGGLANLRQDQGQPAPTNTGQAGAPPAQPAPAEAAPDPMAQLSQAKQMLDQGLIDEQDYEAVKKKVLGL